MILSGNYLYLYGLLCCFSGSMLGAAAMYRFMVYLYLKNMRIAREEAIKRLPKLEPGKPCVECTSHKPGAEPVRDYCSHKKCQTYNMMFGRKTTIVSCFSARFHGHCGLDGHDFVSKAVAE